MKLTAKPSKKILTAELVTAIWSNDLEGAMDLIKQGANVNSHTIDGHYKKSLLMSAIEFKHFNIGRLLVKSGANVNLQSFCKDERVFCTPLQRTLVVGARPEIELLVQDLIERGADINIIDYIGKTPLTFAIRGRHKTMTALLVELGAKLKMNKSNMDDALYVAMITDQPEVAALIEDRLLAKAADFSSNHLSDQNTAEHAKPAQRARL